MIATLSPPDLHRVRANVLRMISGLLLAAPATDVLEELAAEETWEVIGLFARPPECQPLRDIVQAERYDTERLRLEYHALFTAPFASYVFPFESCYRVTTPPGPLMGAAALEVQAAYADAGFAVSADLGEPPDHAALELAFVAELLEQYASTVGAGDSESAGQLPSRVQSFCDDHLNAWLPAFRDRIRCTGASRFYTAVAILAAGIAEQSGSSPVQPTDSQLNLERRGGHTD